MRTITVIGKGRTTVPPDLAHVTIGVRVSGATAHTVLAEVNERAGGLIDSLRAAGLTDADLATSGISLYPLHSPNGSRVSGYEASNMLGVTVRDIGRVGAIIDRAAGAAGDSIAIHGISFSVADPESAMGDARAAAIANARARAAEYAAAASVTLGEIVSISESGAGGPAPLLEADAARGGFPIESGTTDLTALVTVVFEID